MMKKFFLELVFFIIIIISWNNISNSVWTEVYEDNKLKSITDGTTTLNIGDIINYDANVDKNGKSVTTSYTSTQGKNGYIDQVFNVSSSKGYTWRVLGVEEGKVLITPTNNIKTIDNKEFYLKGKSGYQYGIEELDNISSVFRYGYGASGARSIKDTDINKITGYVPEVDYNLNKNQNNEILYGRDITFKLSDNGKIEEHYKLELDGKWYDASFETEIEDFIYLDENGWKKLQGKDSVTLKNNFYTYNFLNHIAYNNIYNMLNEDNSYWLGNYSTQILYGGNVKYGFKRTAGGVIDYDNFLSSTSFEDWHEKKASVRPVVKLNENVKLEKVNENNGIYNIVMPQTINVTGISLEEDSYEMDIGDTQTLKVNIIPVDATNKNITFKSSNEQIVMVSNTGTIKAISEGEATITVITEDGEYKAFCKVTVLEEQGPNNDINNIVEGPSNNDVVNSTNNFNNNDNSVSKDILPHTGENTKKVLFVIALIGAIGGYIGYKKYWI